MADFTATFEAGANGNNITTAGGQASATAWDNVVGPPVYSNAQFAHGSLAAKYTSGEKYCDWTIAPLTEHFGRIYIYAAALPGAFCKVIRGDFILYIFDTGLIRIATGSDTGGHNFATPFPTSTWMRFEYRIFHDAVNGTISGRLYTGDSAVADESYDSGTFDTSFTAAFMRYGPDASWASDVYLDDIVGNATAWPGPFVGAPTNTVAPVASGTPTVGQTLSVTDGTWTGTGPITYTYQWQRDNLGGGIYGDIAGETNNTYLLALADLACNIRCVVTATNAGGSTDANSNALGPVVSPLAPAGPPKRSRILLLDENQSILLTR